MSTDAAPAVDGRLDRLHREIEREDAFTQVFVVLTVVAPWILPLQAMAFGILQGRLPVHTYSGVPEIRYRNPTSFPRIESAVALHSNGAVFWVQAAMTCLNLAISSERCAGACCQDT